MHFETRHRALAWVIAGLLLVAGLAAATGQPARGAQVRAEGPATSSMAEETSRPTEPVTTTTTEDVPAAAAAPSTETTIAQASPSAVGTDVNGFGPRDPGAVEIGSQAGATSWSGVSNGIAITLSSDTPSPTAGTAVHFQITATTADAPCCNIHLVYGDGYQDASGAAWTCPGGGPAGPGTTSATFTHTFGAAGHWQLLVGVGTGSCSTPSNLEGELYTWIDVGTGPSTGQGPALPTFTGSAGQYPSDPPRTIGVDGRAEDADGFVTGVTIDWGDGTHDAFPGDGMGCQQTPSGWPAHSLVVVPPYPAPYARHTYATNGNWTITVTVTSTGCDGSDQQEGAMSYQTATNSSDP